MNRALGVFLAFLQQGLTAFGGPVAHIGYFRGEFVERRAWLDETAFADIVALCQSLPGPASSQVGMSIGLLRAGLPGALLAWLGFTAPSAVALALFGGALGGAGTADQGAWLHGIKVVAVAVVAQAVWSMSRTLCPDRQRLSIAFVGALLALAVPSALGQLGTIAAGAAAGLVVVRDTSPAATPGFAVPLPRWISVVALIAFFALFALLPVAAAMFRAPGIDLFASFYRSGALVFGGGHVVLPLLRNELVSAGLIDDGTFLAGYGAAQAVPGPLFTFAAYLGTVLHGPVSGWRGAIVCLTGIFLPSFLLVIGMVPVWERLRRHKSVRAALAGVNAAVVGLLLAALYMPLWKSVILEWGDFAMGLGALLLLSAWRVPSWVVVVIGGVIAQVAWSG